jgi:hypothetical protein
MFDSATPNSDPLQLPADAYWHLVRTLRLTLPPPLGDDPDDLLRRDRAAIARIAALVPANAALARTDPSPFSLPRVPIAQARWEPDQGEGERAFSESDPASRHSRNETAVRPPSPLVQPASRSSARPTSSSQSSCQVRPSRSISAIAAVGPQVPAG